MTPNNGATNVSINQAFVSRFNELLINAYDGTIKVFAGFESGFNTRAMVCEKGSPDSIFIDSNCYNVDIQAIPSESYEWISTY